jgi:membrane protease YdiL (CAAX protease family)
VAYKVGFFTSVGESFRWGNLVFIVLSVVLALVLAYFAEVYIYVNFSAAYFNNTTYTSLESVLGFLPAWFSWLLLGVIGPISEEIIFRGCIYRLFKNDKLAFAVSAALFTPLHAGFTIWIVYYLPSTLLITYAYHRRKQLTDSILVHAGNNILITYAFSSLNAVFKLLG